MYMPKKGKTKKKISQLILVDGGEMIVCVPKNAFYQLPQFKGLPVEFQVCSIPS